MLKYVLKVQSEANQCIQTHQKKIFSNLIFSNVVILEKLRRQMYKGSILLLCIFNIAYSQFSSYIPAYSVHQPSYFEYGSAPFRNSFDSYIPPYDISFELPRYVYEASLPIDPNVFGVGTNLDPYSPQCDPPRISISGVCVCPNNGIFISNICLPNTGGSGLCFPPRRIIDDECICPNHGIYTSTGRCLNVNGPAPTVPPCEPPSVELNGICVCPYNGIFVSGQCFTRDDKLHFPTEPIGPIKYPATKCGLALIDRSYDGTNNNLGQKLWGSKGSFLQRRAPANYLDGIGIPVDHLPNPRRISNIVGSLDGSPVTSRQQLTMAFVIWGQFLDHDIGLTTQGKSEEFNIPIPPMDAFFTDEKYLEFFRSHYSFGKPRKHRNSITSWVDGSQVYGSDQTMSRYLRSFRHGKLKTYEDTNLLPKNLKTGMFEAGDERANENVYLTIYHTVFVREHNRVCEELLKKDPTLNDEELYQAGRNFVIGLLQKITYDQFLPTLLGAEYQYIIGDYTEYKPYLNPNIPIELSTAAFRIGHSLLVDKYRLINSSFQTFQNLFLKDLFFRRDLVENHFDDLLRGLLFTLMKERSAELINDVRNLLVVDPENREFKLDLYSLNIQRGRDHGLPSFNSARKAVGLKKLKSFSDLTSDPEVVNRLEQVYDSIDDVDMIVGIFAEDPVSQGVSGELGAKIIGQAFRNLRDGDRHWYKNYPKEVVDQIQNTTFSDVIQRNTEVKGIQKYIFLEPI